MGEAGAVSGEGDWEVTVSIKSGMLRVSLKRFRIASALSVLLLVLILATACQCQTGGSARSEMKSCNEIDRLGLATLQAGAPISIPDLPGCSVRLLSLSDKTCYDPGVDIDITAILKVRDNCVWSVVTSRYPLVLFYPITITNESGHDAPLTRRGSAELEDAWQVLRDHPRMMGATPLGPDLDCLSVQLPLSEWYDISASGTYTVTLVWHNLSGEPAEIPSNSVTFTRLP